MFTPMQQAAHSAGMQRDLMSAFSQENQSRVAQSREARRYAMSDMQDQREMQVMLARLQHERELAEKKMKYDALMRQIESDKARGVISSTKWDEGLKSLLGG